MSKYIMLTVIEKIDTNNVDLFIHSDSVGQLIAIKQIHLYNEDGKEERICRITQAMVDKLKSLKIPV